MKHGELRHHGYQTLPGEPVEYIGGDGRVVYSGPVMSVTESVTERWCATCEKWVSTNGVMGQLRFMAKHSH